MIKFPQSGLVQNFGRNTCYVFSLAHCVEVLTGEQLCAHHVFELAAQSKHVGPNAYVYNAEAFCNEIAECLLEESNYKFSVIKSLSEPDLPDVCSIQHWVYDGVSPSYHHFRLADWDPLETMAIAVLKGKIIDYRIVKFKNQSEDDDLRQLRFTL